MTEVCCFGCRKSDIERCSQRKLATKVSRNDLTMARTGTNKEKSPTLRRATPSSAIQIKWSVTITSSGAKRMAPRAGIQRKLSNHLCWQQKAHWSSKWIHCRWKRPPRTSLPAHWISSRTICCQKAKAPSLEHRFHRLSTDMWLLRWRFRSVDQVE